MRMLYETPSWWPGNGVTPVADTIFTVHTVAMKDMADASKRSLVFRAFAKTSIGPTYSVYAFKNFLDAYACPCVGGAPDLTADYKVLAHATGISSPVGTMTGVSFTNNAAYGPDMTDLRIEYASTVFSADWDRYYHYSDNIQSLIAYKIQAVLREYTGEGAALHEYETFGIEAGNEYLKTRGRRIIVAYGETDKMPYGSMRRFSAHVGIVIKVGMAGKPDAVDHRVVDDANAVASIIGDERRTLDGLANAGVDVLTISEPEPGVDPQSGTAFVQCDITCVAKVRHILKPNIAD